MPSQQEEPISRPIEIPTAVQSWITAVIAQSRAEGHVEGFVAGVTLDFDQTNGQVARVLNSFLSSVEGVLRKNISDQAVLRYFCNVKRYCIRIAVVFPEDVYIARYEEIYSFLSGVEKAIPDIWTQLSSFIIDSTVITTSPEIPLDADSLGRDFPYTTTPI